MGRAAAVCLAVVLSLAACGSGDSSSSSPPPVPTARLGAAMAGDPAHHDVLLFGGRGRSEVEGDTWLWSGQWQRVATRTAPPARSFAAAAPDGHGGVLLFGGDPSDPSDRHNDTWRWDGSKWSQLHPATVPDGGASRMMAAGPDGVPVLVVAGADGGVATWTWSAGDWRPAVATAEPPWRDDPGFVLDRASARVLMVGGIPRQGGVQAADTWAWDGESWVQLHPAHQPAGGPAAAADIATGPLLYEQDGTWTWSAGDWTQAQPAGAPPWQPYSGLAAIPGASLGDALAIMLTGTAGDAGHTWRWNGFGWAEL